MVEINLNKFLVKCKIHTKKSYQHFLNHFIKMLIKQTNNRLRRKEIKLVSLVDIYLLFISY